MNIALEGLTEKTKFIDAKCKELIALVRQTWPGEEDQEQMTTDDLKRVISDL